MTNLTEDLKRNAEDLKQTLSLIDDPEANVYSREVLQKELRDIEAEIYNIENIKGHNRNGLYWSSVLHKMVTIPE